MNTSAFSQATCSQLDLSPTRRAVVHSPVPVPRGACFPPTRRTQHLAEWLQSVLQASVLDFSACSLCIFLRTQFAQVCTWGGEPALGLVLRLCGLFSCLNVHIYMFAAWGGGAVVATLGSYQMLCAPFSRVPFEMLSGSFLKWARTQNHHLSKLWTNIIRHMWSFFHWLHSQQSGVNK